MQRPGSRTRVRRRVSRPVAALALGALVLAACGSRSSGSPPATAGMSDVIHVVAAENVWGSIAGQIGGRHAQVTSIITNPNTDPHSYEPTASDAKVLAAAQLVIENGVGYDPWVSKLLAADQGHSTVLNVGELVGVATGGNPHRWYRPADVQAVIGRMVADLRTIDPRDSAYFTTRATDFDNIALKPYDDLIAAIKAKYAGTPVGASESIFAMLSPALRLDLITPSAFLKAISEGTEVSAADKATIDGQIRSHRIKIYVYNSQNVTPDVQAQLDEVKAERIPYATITETLAPDGATYQSWQIRQLMGIESALSKAAGSSR